MESFAGVTWPDEPEPGELTEIEAEDIPAQVAREWAASGVLEAELAEIVATEVERVEVLPVLRPVALGRNQARKSTGLRGFRCARRGGEWR